MVFGKNFWDIFGTFWNIFGDTYELWDIFRQFLDSFLLSWDFLKTLITAELDKFLIGMKPCTLLSNRILTPTALPGQVLKKKLKKKWFRVIVFELCTYLDFFEDLYWGH